jgi:photosystem II stability/assembly factor-like uncharacterized protein
VSILFTIKADSVMVSIKQTTMKYAILFSWLFFAVASIQAQYFLDYMRENPSANFYEIEAAVETHYQGKDKGRGSGYKQFKRWAINTEPYVYPGGELYNYSAKIHQEYAAFQKMTAFQKRSTHGNWSEEGPNDYAPGYGWNGGNGRVNCAAFHPTNSNIFYVGTPAGGLWKTTSAGASWTPLTDGMPTIGVADIVVDHSDANTLYILTGDGDGNNSPSIGVLKSIDGGQSWKKTGLTWNMEWDFPNLRRPYKMVMHPTLSNILLVVTSDGIWRTADSGVNWTPVWPNFTYDIEFHPTDPDIVYASGFGFFRSENAGVTWVVDNDPDFPGGYNRTAIAVSADSPDNVYLLFGGNNAGVGTFCGFFTSTDQGADFTLQSNTPNILGYPTNGQDDKHQAGYDLAIIVDPEDADVVYTGCINVWKSDDGGSNWEIVSHWYEKGNTVGYTHADIHMLEIENGKLYCGSDGGIFESTDDGANWFDLSNGLGIMQFYQIDIASNVFSGGTQDNGCNNWNSGSTTATHTIGADGFACLIDYNNTSIRYQSDQDTKYKSTNGGISFFEIGVPGLSNYWNTDWIMDPFDPNIQFLGHLQVYRTTTGGNGFNAWININAGFTNGKGITSLAQGVYQPGMLYASDSESIRRTANAYAANPTWSDVTNGLPVANTKISGITVYPLDSMQVWVTFKGVSAGNKVFFSSNGGTTWTNVSGSLPNVPINCIIHSPIFNEGLYIGTDIGVFYRNDNIGDWIFFDNGLPATRVMDLDISGDRIYAGTHGRGLWSSDLYDECPLQLSLTPANDPSNPNFTGEQVYHAFQSITSSRIITGGLGTDVQYHAGYQTILTDGFWVKTDSQLRITTNGCPE